MCLEHLQGEEASRSDAKTSSTGCFHWLYFEFSPDAWMLHHITRVTECHFCEITNNLEITSWHQVHPSCEGNILSSSPKFPKYQILSVRLNFGGHYTKLCSRHLEYFHQGLKKYTGFELFTYHRISRYRIYMWSCFLQSCLGGNLKD